MKNAYNAGRFFRIVDPAQLRTTLTCKPIS
ncbi:hypothetical protein ACVWZS_000753 [Pseudomonas fragi]